MSDREVRKPHPQNPGRNRLAGQRNRPVRLDGQDAAVSQMNFSVGAILEFVSQFMTLEPGDLIATGTPPGVGPVNPGDRVEVEIPGLGILENSIERR